MNTELLRRARELAEVTGTRVDMRIPSVLAEGEEFALRISVTGPDALPVESFSWKLRFEGSVGVEGLPSSFRLSPESATAGIPGLTATGPEVALIRAVIDAPQAPEIVPSVSSNPAWVFSDPPYRVFWGDLHVHTEYSNCSAWRCLDPEWCYQCARDVSLLDFAAPADHLRGIASDPARWPRLQELSRAYNDPGRFVSFLAFESSHAQGFGGDNNVYYLDDDAPYFWLDREDMRGIKPEVYLRDLWRQLDGNGKPYFTVPHHTGRAGKYRTWSEDCYDPQHEPLFEIYSSWGSSEKRWSRFPISGGNNDDTSYYVDALQAGARFGVIASSDDHATLPGTVHQFRAEPFGAPTLNGFAHKGLAAIRAPALTREALFAAMQRRDVYATSHVRSLLDLTIGDAHMGQAVVADDVLRKKREVRVRYTAHGATTAKAVLMRNGEPLATEPVGGAQIRADAGELVFEDTSPLETIALRGSKYHPGGFAVYYLRIEDGDGSQQWTSPVWIDLE